MEKKTTSRGIGWSRLVDFIKFAQGFMPYPVVRKFTATVALLLSQCRFDEFLHSWRNAGWVGVQALH